jgi:phosphatidylserine/phosphatidylglycerophosphate/cardiolipin synthase-like enzyme
MAGAWKELESLLAAEGHRLRAIRGVLDVRVGDSFREGWLSGDPALVVTGAPSCPIDEATVAAAARGAPYRIEVAAAPRPELAERRARAYQPPSGLPLSPVDEPAELVLHVSPDEAWPPLRDEIEGLEHRITAGMYELTARHVFAALRDGIRARSAIFRLVLDGDRDERPRSSATDVDERTGVRWLRRELRGALDLSWASAGGPGDVFATAYHIKVAVVDGRSMWMSSGNWQTVNQPETDPDRWGWDDLAKANREWHVIVRNRKLASTIERFLDYDYAISRVNPPSEWRTRYELLAPDWFAAPRRAAERAFAGPPRHTPLVISRRVRLTPLLSPDNFSTEVVAFVRSATRSLWIQNPVISVFEGSPPAAVELMEAVRDKMRDDRIDVRIILRDTMTPGALENLDRFGIDLSRVKLQHRCHNKGVIVDSRSVLVGSHNWTGHGILDNRDASLIIDDEEAADYYGRVFAFDWEQLAERDAPLARFTPLPRVAGEPIPPGWDAVRREDVLPPQ